MSSQTLLIATSNKHKLGEIRDFLKGVPWRIVGLDEFPACEAPDETGDTFEKNAIIKASAYCERFGVACVADDSGIVIDALHGEPGVLSARYAAPNATDEDNNKKVLRALEGVPDALRSARFICCCALVVPGNAPHIETGTVEGHIAHAITGANGFGYDPLFIPDGYKETFGVLSPAIKAAISHRAKAFRKLRVHLDPSAA